jgi:hypothetical protein
LLRSVFFAQDGQVQSEQSVNEPAFGVFDSHPEIAILFVSQIGNDFVEAARSAERIIFILRNHPIADSHFRVILAFLVNDAPALFRRWPPQTIARSIETSQAEQVREEAEFSVAMQTGCILKKYELSTNAPVGFHREPAPFRVIPSLLEALVPQNDAQKGLIDLQPSQLAAVLDEAPFSEFIHEKIDPRSRCPNHLCQHFL